MRSGPVKHLSRLTSITGAALTLLTGLKLSIAEPESQELTMPEPASEAPPSAPQEEGGLELDPFIELVTRGGSFELFNRSAMTLVTLKRGAQELDALPPGSSWSGEDEALKDLFGKDRALQTHAQFKLSEWGEAMRETLPSPPPLLLLTEEERAAVGRGEREPPRAPILSERGLSAQRLLAELHLRTAGLSPRAESISEVVMTTGTPMIEPNVIALRRALPPQTLTWARDAQPLQVALAAQAALFAPPNLLLKELFSQLDPRQVPSELERWRPAGYERLKDARELLRDAFERHAADALPALMSSPEWSADRGFDEPLLALVFADEEQVLEALKGRAEASPEGRDAEGLRAQVKRLMSLSLDELYASFLSAQSEGAERAVVQNKALEVAYRLNRVAQRPEVSLVAQALCGTLDGAAQGALNQGQLLAARSYIHLGRALCHGSPFFMMRAASLMGSTGDRAYFRGDFQSAQHWYRAALMLRDEPMSRVKLIDTLSQLALRANVEADYRRARQLIDEAREWDSTALPHRELLALADQLMPRADHRARLGLILIIAALAVIVVVRLMRILSGPERAGRG